MTFTPRLQYLSGLCLGLTLGLAALYSQPPPAHTLSPSPALPGPLHP